MKALSPLVLPSIFAAFNVFAEVHTWHFQSGVKIEGEYVSRVGTNSVVVRREGKDYTLPINKLSPEDQAYALDTHIVLPPPFVAFGVTLGQKLTPGMATRREIPMPPPPPGFDAGPPLIEYTFRPTKPLDGFSEYNLDFTPKTKLVYMVCGRSYFTDGLAMVDARTKLEKALEQKHGTPEHETMRIGDSKLELTHYHSGHTKITISDDRVLGDQPRWAISLGYRDTDLEAQAEKEKDASDQGLQKLKKQL